MHLCDFFIECAQIEQKIEQNRQFLIQLPTFHPYKAFIELQDGNNKITTTSLSSYLKSQGLLCTEQECSIFIQKPFKYVDFLRTILPTDQTLRKVISIQEPKQQLSPETQLALARHLNLQIDLMNSLKTSKNVFFEGTIQDVQKYFKDNLAYISDKELEQISRLLDQQGEGIISTQQFIKKKNEEYDFTFSTPKQVKNNLQSMTTQKKKEQKLTYNGRSNKKPIQDLNNRDDNYLSIESPLIPLVALMRREIKLNSLKKRLLSQKTFNFLDAFKALDQNSNGYITMQDYDKFLDQQQGSSKYLFQQKKELQFSDFLNLMMLNENIQISNKLFVDKPIEEIFSNQTLQLFKEYLELLQTPPPKLNGSKDLFKLIDSVTRDNYISSTDLQQYLYMNGLRYTASEVSLLINRYDHNRDGKLCFFEFQDL
ncbi:unnamed protein product [Paramecium primaurelia]|uniref:EF-hand domain-containing protein n=1 Tax=Paramecium primaurelia TaxID=5886 RepID=A0A8S1NNB1_PARPR|nr:unnamed protein product [Paramecium primaurelia]